MTKIEDILEYIETRASTNAILSGKVYLSYPGDPLPNVKQYGLRVYFGNENWKVLERKKIGRIVNEIYNINVDLVFNRSLTPRKAFSDGQGLSYWENILTALFINNKNNGLFKDSYWSPQGTMEINADSVILKGNLFIHLENIYP